jgi:hypothetical protein
MLINAHQTEVRTNLKKKKMQENTFWRVSNEMTVDSSVKYITFWASGLNSALFHCISRLLCCTVSDSRFEFLTLFMCGSILLGTGTEVFLLQIWIIF